MKLAEALLRRKELQDIIARMGAIQQKELFEVKAKRVNVTENIDDVTAMVPKITWDEFDAAYNFHAKRLRQIDAAIQQANWTTEIDVPESVNDDYVATPAK